MSARRGEVWWIDLPEPTGSSAGYARPLLVVQSDAFNRGRVGTVVVVALTTNLRPADAPGNVLLHPEESGLRQPSVVNVSQLLTVSRAQLRDRSRTVPPAVMFLIDEVLRSVLDLP